MQRKTKTTLRQSHGSVCGAGWGGGDTADVIGGPSTVPKCPERNQPGRREAPISCAQPKTQSGHFRGQGMARIFWDGRSVGSQEGPDPPKQRRAGSRGGCRGQERSAPGPRVPARPTAHGFHLGPANTYHLKSSSLPVFQTSRASPIPRAASSY